MSVELNCECWLQVDPGNVVLEGHSIFMEAEWPTPFADHVMWIHWSGNPNLIGDRCKQSTIALHKRTVHLVNHMDLPSQALLWLVNLLLQLVKGFHPELTSQKGKMLSCWFKYASSRTFTFPFSWMAPGGRGQVKYSRTSCPKASDHLLRFASKVAIFPSVSESPWVSNTVKMAPSWSALSAMLHWDSQDRKVRVTFSVFFCQNYGGHLNYFMSVCLILGVHFFQPFFPAIEGNEHKELHRTTTAIKPGRPCPAWPGWRALTSTGVTKLLCYFEPYACCWCCCCGGGYCCCFANIGKHVVCLCVFFLPVLPPHGQTS